MKSVSVTHKKFGKRLKELRSARNLTQEQVAERIEVDRSYMGFLERGERNPTLSKLIKLSKVLDVNLSELLKGL